MTSDAGEVRTSRWGAQLNTVDYMRDSVFFDGPTARSMHTRFWLLLTLASAIATFGIIANSTATVIGAMIVAPLMRPIQGTMVSTVLGDRTNLVRSIVIMLAGAGAAVLTGFVLGLLVVQPVLASTNAQVAARVSPGIVDLLAALATGIVGSIALVRKDISDTLPGVAIAISLVPPLCVAGLTLESGAPDQAIGALLLFATNVAAILATGSVVMAIYGFSRLRLDPNEDEEHARRRRARSYLTMFVMLGLVAIPLAFSSAGALERQTRIGQVTAFVEEATEGSRWSIVAINERENDVIYVIVKGSPPVPDVDPVFDAMEEAGIDTSTVILEFIPSYTFDVDGERDSF